MVPGGLERETGAGSQKLHPSNLIDSLTGNFEDVPSAADVTLTEFNIKPLTCCFNFFMVNKLESFYFPFAPSSVSLITPKGTMFTRDVKTIPERAMFNQTVCSSGWNQNLQLHSPLWNSLDIPDVH